MLSGPRDEAFHRRYCDACPAEECGEYYHHLFLSVCGGKPRLGDDYSTYNDEGGKVSRWECHSLTLDELRAFDLAEEVGA